MALSVLADSALEHFRGGYHNKAMYGAPAIAALSIAASLAGSRTPRRRTFSRAVHVTSICVGLAGLGFHAYNVLKRPGGLSWNNLFYAAPIGAPGALVVAGTIGLAAEPLSVRDEILSPDTPATLRPAGRFLAFAVGGSMLATAAEASLLHFRGAFHNGAMTLPVAIPPLAGIGLLAQAAMPARTRSAWPGRATQLTGILGLVGTVFHILGVRRHMGGWRNWRQTTLAGPPTPAPLSFTGLGLAGLAALDALHEPSEARHD